ncbi:DoxX family membrane protein [Granulicella sp. S190]|uniref:DoxX family membrane protein n=1 Tax=Granulicella sp. S190 TaxID=1747226 RepID=UPI00131E1FAA|nr:DoxX family membrane protein [Granulicella sp. S190]
MVEASKFSDEQIAYALLRTVVGVNLMMHGVSRMIAGPGEFAAKLVMQFGHAPLPAWSVWFFGLILPTVEGLFGLLILIGLRTRAALIAAALLILVLTFGSSLLQDWAASGTQLTYALIYAILIFLHRYNSWSIDTWMKRP